MTAILLPGVLLAAGCSTSVAATPTTTVTSVVETTETVTSTQVTTTTETSTTVVGVTSTAVVGGSGPDPDAAGPVTGPACPGSPEYVDETVDGLDGATAAAWQKAQRDAGAAGVTMCLNDGKRSRAQQQATFDDYVAKYGEAAARQYVLPPDKSAHVAGYAIDVQPAAADAWLEATDGAYGLCRMYDNEIWHFEYAATFTLGCPPRRAAPER